MENEILAGDFLLVNKFVFGGTTPRTIPKGPRGPWVANECLSGCVNEKGYKLTTPAPKAPYGGSQGGQTGGQGGGNEATGLLRQILTELQSIRQMVNAKTTLANDPLEIQVEEQQESAPF